MATISPILPAIPFGSLAGSGFASKILTVLPSSCRPGAGRGIATADQAVDLLPRPAPIDMGIVGTATAFIACFRLVLLDPRRLAGFDEIDRFEHGLDAHGKQPVEIHRAERVGCRYRRLFLDQHVAGIESVVRPEDRQAGFALALDDRPVDGARPAISGKQRRMILDRAVGRDVQKIFGNEQRHESHHLQIRLERAEFLPHPRLAIGRRLINRQLGGERRFFQRIGLGAFLLGRDISRDDILAALDQRFEHRLAECLLAVNDNTHGKYA